MARRAGNEKIFAVIYWKTIKNKSAAPNVGDG